MKNSPEVQANLGVQKLLKERISAVSMLSNTAQRRTTPAAQARAEYRLAIIEEQLAALGYVFNRAKLHGPITRTETDKEKRQRQPRSYVLPHPRQDAIGEVLEKHVVTYDDGARMLPKGTITEVAKELGLTRQRVAQVTKKLKLKTQVSSQELECPQCHEKKSHHSKLCKNCRAEAAWSYTPCESCSKPIRYRIKDQELRLRRAEKGVTNLTPEGKNAAYTGRRFCNRQCFGSWFGKNHGWNSRPGREAWRAKRHGRFDDETVDKIKALAAEGYRPAFIARIVGLDVKTRADYQAVYNIVRERTYRDEPAQV